MSALQISVELRPTNGRNITAEEIGQTLFDLQHIKDINNFSVLVGGQFEDGSRKVATISFELDSIEAMQAAVTLNDLGISYVPNLTNVEKEQASAYLDHDRVYRVREVEAK